MKNNHQIILIIIFLTYSIVSTYSFLQFKLFKNHEKQIKQSSQFSTKNYCINKNTFNSKIDNKDDVFYDQLCYYKDITYYIELFHQNKLHHISLDLTSPYSWLKSSHCTVVQTGKPCSLIEENSIQDKKAAKKHKKASSQNQDSQQNNQEKPSPNKLARIEGSNQFVEGYLQHNKDIQFWTKDSGRLSRLFDILMLGFYMIEEKEKVTLQKTNFINTTRLSENMDQLSDGALSLRFDENSQNSFLEEIFQYTQTTDKIITIYINDKESQLTIGQLSIKNTEEGYSGIVWVPFDNSQQNTAYGKLPLIQSIMLESIAKDQQQDIERDEDNSIFAVFSLSASYIGLPEIAMNQLTKQFKSKYGLDCTVSQHSYFQCTSTRSKEDTLTQNLLIVMKEGAVSLPLSSLVLKQSKKKVTLNLCLISKEQNQKEKSFIILGEPYFQKYFTALDYRNNRVGFAIKRLGQHNNFISTVSLIRFVSFVFFTGCCFLICFRPLKKMFQTVMGGKQLYNKKSPQGRRLKYQPIQQNPYEEVSGTLKEVMQQMQQAS